MRWLLYVPRNVSQAYSDESLGIIKKQKELIERIQSDNAVRARGTLHGQHSCQAPVILRRPGVPPPQSLKAELELENRFAQKKAARDSKLSSLHDQIDSYTMKGEVEKRNIATLTSNIETVKAKTEALRATVGGSRAAEENLKTQRKQTRILENRLDKALVKFNEVLAENKTLRQEIDDLRQERVVFDGIYRRMEGELEASKRSMAHVIEESNMAYEVRDAATVQLMDLQAAMAREAEEYDGELRELDGRLEDEDREARAMEGDRRGEMTAQQEAVLKERARSGERDLLRARAAMASASERAASYEEALRRVRDATGIDSVDDLVASFVRGEEGNFSLFNFIAEQSTEIERLEDAIAAMRADADAAASSSGARASSSRGVLRDLEGKLAASRAAVATFEERCGGSQAAVDAVASAVGRTYRRLECEERGVGHVLAGTSVTETNAIAFLSVVEQRAAELIEAFMAAKAVDDGIAVPVASGEGGGDADGGFMLTGLPEASPEGGRRVSSELRVSATERRAAASAVASMLGPGPTSGKSPDRAAMAVDAPRLKDMGAGDSDSDSEGEVRPLTTTELRSDVNRLRQRAR